MTSDVLPHHSDAAVVLQGSVTAEIARLAEAVSLVQRGIASRVVLSVPRQSYWGQPTAPAARSYIEKNYDNDVAARTEFCETGPGVDSTQDEAQAIGACLEAHQWHTVTVVTSNYHTRRARMIWRRTMRKHYPDIQIWVDSAVDPDFQQPWWWRSRRSAKIWFMESSKWVWTLLGGQ